MSPLGRDKGAEEVGRRRGGTPRWISYRWWDWGRCWCNRARRTTIRLPGRRGRRRNTPSPLQRLLRRPLSMFGRRRRRRLRARWWRQSHRKPVVCRRRWWYWSWRTEPSRPRRHLKHRSVLHNYTSIGIRNIYRLRSNDKRHRLKQSAPPAVQLEINIWDEQVS